MIEADVHSDDWDYQVFFDAEPWFVDASDDDILDLVDIGYSHDTAADTVGLYFEDSDPKLSALFAHVRRKRNIGFEVVINREHADAWIRANRPHLEEYLDGEVPEGYRPIQGIGDRVMWEPPTV